MQYLLICNDMGENTPAASVAFFGNHSFVFSNFTESEVMEASRNILLPYVYNEKDTIKYWKKYNSMNDEQLKLVMDIYKLRLSTHERIFLNESVREKLLKWFNGEIAECIESFNEIDIFFSDCV